MASYGDTATKKKISKFTISGNSLLLNQVGSAQSPPCSKSILLKHSLIQYQITMICDDIPPEMVYLINLV